MSKFDPNPYDKCPIEENSAYMIRFVELNDAEFLLPCYANPTESVITNSFNCTMGYDAKTIEKMREYIEGWQHSYEQKAYIRWSVVNKNHYKVVGSIELLNRQSTDYFNNCAILRLDLCDEYEKSDEISKILELIIPNVFSWFDCEFLSTKVSPLAIERIESLKKFGFKKSQQILKCGNGSEFSGFWVLNNKY